MTDFGDQAVLLPLAVSVGLGLVLLGWRRGALAWSAAIGATFGTMFVLKLSFLACGHLLPGLGLRSPSGHTAASAAVYGGLFALAMTLAVGHRRWTLVCAVSMAIVIGASRLALGVHTGLEVVIGGAVGICGAYCAVTFAGPPPTTVRFRGMAAVSLTLLVLFHGFHMPAEAAIGALAPRVWPLSYCR